ncbi:MAG: sensor histidine kinase, partial [Acidimicrobiia bacterium]
AIVDDLLVAARTDIGELTVAAVPIDLRAQAAQILEILDPNHSIPVLGHAPTAAGDPTRVRQILRNLITNAKRYGGDNISVVLGSQSNTFASLAVKDNGDPIPANHQERIFKPYQRADDRPDQPGSIGLGLAVSRRLARLMSGDLTYLYQDGHSIFELSLPVVAEPHLEADQETAAAAR